MAILKRAQTLLNGEEPVYPQAQPQPMPGLPPLTNVGRPTPAVPAPAVPPPAPTFQPPRNEAQARAQMQRPPTPVVPPPSVQPPAVQPPPPSIQPPVAPPPPPPAPPPPSAPPPDDGGVGNFGPGNDLRYTQLSPQASGRLTGIGGQVDTARGALAADPGLDPFKEVAGGTYARGTDTQGATDILSKELANLSTAPDRQQMALDTLRLAEEQGQPAYDQRMREVGRNAAKFGRIGAGMTTNELTSVEQARSRDLDQLRRGTALEAAGQTMADRLAKTSAAGSVAGQLGARDVTETGVQQGLRGELRGERGAATDYATTRAGLAGQKLAGLSATEQAQQDQEARQRGELRGERGYQGDVAAKALEDSIRQRQLEESLTQGAFGRSMDRAQLGLAGAGIAAGNAAQAQTGTQDFLQQLALENALRNRTATGGR